MESNTTEITTLITENLPNWTNEPGHILISGLENRYRTNSSSYENMTTSFSDYLIECKKQINGIWSKNKKEEFRDNNSQFLLKVIDLCNLEITAKKERVEGKRKEYRNQLCDGFLDVVSIFLNQSVLETFDKSKCEEILKYIKDNTILNTLFSINDEECDVEMMEMSFKNFLNNCKDKMYEYPEYFNKEVSEHIRDLCNKKEGYEQRKEEERVNQKKETGGKKTAIAVVAFFAGFFSAAVAEKLLNSSKNNKEKE